MSEEPDRWAGLEWENLLVFAKQRLNLKPSDFWQLTFAEFWPMYNHVMGKVSKPMTKRDVESLEEQWLGKFRATGS